MDEFNKEGSEKMKAESGMSHLQKLHKRVEEAENELKEMSPQHPVHDWTQEKLESFQAEIARIQKEEGIVEAEDVGAVLEDDDEKRAAS